MKIEYPDILNIIANKISLNQGRAFLVGGCVRDGLLGIKAKDFDIEIYGLSTEQLISLLRPFGKVIDVGKSFGIIKLVSTDNEFDFALPRKEAKTAKGHKGFLVNTDPFMTYKEAAKRRDFTINSIGYDLISEKIEDPYNGQEDLEKRILRHVSAAFSEDPLRVLRAMQFAARFNCIISPETVELCRSLDLSELSKERLFMEFKKLLLKAEKPSRGFFWAEKLGILEYFPELKQLIGVPQDPEWHPEGDVWTHTLEVVDQMAKIRSGDEKGDDYKALTMLFAALCDDLGKATTTAFLNGHWRSYGHEEAGVELTRSFLARLTNEKKLVDEVVLLVKEHMKPFLLYKADQKQKVSNSAIRRLSLRVDIPDLVQLAQADNSNKPFPEGAWLLERAEKLEVIKEKPKPFLRGRDLLQLGFKPGPFIGEIIHAAFEAQLNEEINSKEDAIKWLKNNYNTI